MADSGFKGLAPPVVPLCALAYLSGGRRAELAGLLLADIDLDLDPPAIRVGSDGVDLNFPDKRNPEVSLAESCRPVICSSMSVIQELQEGRFRGG